MKIARIALVALAALSLAGCGTQTDPTGLASPLASPSATATSSPAPAASAEPAEPLPVPEDGQPAQPNVPPAAWNDDELIGTCKVAWNDSGQVEGWGDYSPDAAIEQSGGSYRVTFVSASGADPRSCDISGSPEEPVVTIG